MSESCGLAGAPGIQFDRCIYNNATESIYPVSHLPIIVWGLQSTGTIPAKVT